MRKKEFYQLRNNRDTFFLRNKYAGYQTLFAPKKSGAGWSVNPNKIIRENIYTIISFSLIVAASIVILAQM